MSAVVELGEVVSFTGGGTPDRGNPDFWNGEIPWATVKDFKTGSRLERPAESITQLGVKSSATNLIPEGTLVIPTRMALGKAAITTLDMAINQDLKAVIPASNLDARYLLWYFIANSQKIDAMGKGATVKGITLDQLRRLKLPLPALSEQRRIAAILDKAEALRSKRRKAIAKLDQLLQSVFLEMFGDPVTNSKNWPLKSFLEVGQWKSGATPSKSNSDYWIGSYPWVSPKDMKVDHIDDSQDHLNEEVFAKTSLKKIDPNHILIVVRGMILAHSFPVAINNVSIAINQDMKAIEPNSDFSSKYLISCIKSLKQRFLSVVSSAGHGTKRLDLRDAAEISIPMPDISLQKKFDDIYDKVKIQKKNLIQQETKLQDFISSIQYNYFQ